MSEKREREKEKGDSEGKCEEEDKKKRYCGKLREDAVNSVVREERARER